MLKLNTNKECDRLHALMCSLNRHDDGVLLCMQGHRISSFRERWPVDMPDMVLYDNGPPKLFHQETYSWIQRTSTSNGKEEKQGGLVIQYDNVQYYY